MRYQQTLRLFCVSFLLTLLTVAFVCLFLLVDHAGTQYQNRPAPPALALEQTGDVLHYRAAMLGKEYPISLEYYNRWETFRKQYACILTPRTLRAAEQVYSLAMTALYERYHQYKAEQYAQNVAKAQESIPIP